MCVYLMAYSLFYVSTRALASPRHLPSWTLVTPVTPISLLCSCSPCDGGPSGRSAPSAPSLQCEPPGSLVVPYLSSFSALFCYPSPSVSSVLSLPPSSLSSSHSFSSLSSSTLSCLLCLSFLSFSHLSISSNARLVPNHGMNSRSRLA